MPKMDIIRNPVIRRIAEWAFWLVKIGAAGAVAVVILSVLMLGYSFIPVHIENPDGNTDYIWPAGSVWFRVTEGIGYGKFDDNGFNNPEVIEHPDILLLGSSHMEAQYVPQGDSVSAVMNDLFGGEHEVYNLGISGHTIFKTCQYLPKNIELYKDSVKYVILETFFVSMTEKDVDNVLNHTVQYSSSKHSPVMQFVNEVPGLRILDHQRKVGFVDLFKDSGRTTKVFSIDGDEYSSEVSASDLPAYDRLFGYLEDIEKETGVELIIYYHPTETFDGEGHILFEEGNAYEAFAAAAEAHHIDFVDMADDFVRMFNEEHHVAHGFCTGRLGIGHLNSYGHRASAETLVRVIREKDQAQKESGKEADADVND